MSVEVEMFTLIIFHKIKENIRSDNKEWIQARRCEIFSVNLDLL